METLPTTKEFQLVPLDSIILSKTNPRRHFDKAKLDALAESVRDQGILEPLLVRPNGQPGKLELVAGERRYKAGLQAKLTHAPVIVRHLTDQQALEIQLIENIQREDMNELEEGIGFRALLNFKVDGKPVHTVKSIAERISRPIAHVYARLKLGDCTMPVEKAFYAGHITAGHAILLARLEAQDQHDTLKVIVRHEMSVKRLAEYIAQEIHLDLSKAPFPTDDAELVKGAGSCVTCPKRSGTQPELFPDIRSKDICMDRACYRAKTAALVELRLSEAEKGTVKLSSHYANEYGLKKEPGVLYLSYSAGGGYVVVEGKKSCEHIVTGLYIDGPQIGKTARVCTGKTCKVHNRFSSEESPRQKAARAAEAQRVKQDALVRRRAYEAVLERVKEPKFSRADLVGIAMTMYGEMHADTQKDVMGVFSIERKKGKHGGWDQWGPAVDWLRQASDVDVSKFLIAAVLRCAPGTNGYSYHKELTEEVEGIYRRTKVDVDKIRKAVIAEGSKAPVQTSVKAKAAGGGK